MSNYIFPSPQIKRNSTHKNLVNKSVTVSAILKSSLGLILGETLEGRDVAFSSFGIFTTMGHR